MLVTARLAAEASGDAYHRALCYMDQSEVYLELDMRQEAAESAQEAFSGFQALGVGYESGKALANLAIAQGRMGKLARALDLFSRARDVFLREGNVVWPSLLDLYQALMLHNSRRYAEARELAANSMAVFRSRKMTGKEVLCRLLLARIALGTNTAEAREHCTAALNLLEGLEAPHLRHQAWVLLGQVEEHERRFADARACYETALAEAESLRSVLRGDELKIAFMSGAREIYQGLVRLCLKSELGPISPEAAFAYVEQAKSRSLRELVSEAAVPHRRVSRDSALGRQAVALKEELNWYYHRIELEQGGEQPHSVERLAELEQQARQCERKLAALLRELPPPEAGTAELGATSTQPLDTIRRVLEPDTVLVEYFRADERMVAAVVSAASLDFVPLGPSSHVDELTESLHFQLSKFQLGPDYVAACHGALLESTRGHLRNLHRALIEPLQDRLRARKLVFVPHESLHHLPLHALFDGQQYLLDRFAISYAPSASVYALCWNRPASANGPSLVLGVPDPRAPMILSEVHSVAAALPGSELLVGDSATRQVLESRGSRCRFLHIATHGRFREDRPMFSAIRLGDGYLTLYDLDQLSLPVDLATLSGCSTGRSVVAGGDELLGLVRGFLQAGARTLLLTLWDVHDRSTALLMSSFYRRLATGYEKAEALRGAMRELRDTHPHPYFWAPFVLIGKA
jgi:tetratricopeptide (TPR) repeat protein